MKYSVTYNFLAVKKIEELTGVKLTFEDVCIAELIRDLQTAQKFPKIDGFVRLPKTAVNSAFGWEFSPKTILTKINRLLLPELSKDTLKVANWQHRFIGSVKMQSSCNTLTRMTYTEATAEKGRSHRSPKTKLRVYFLMFHGKHQTRKPVRES